MNKRDLTPEQIAALNHFLEKCKSSSDPTVVSDVTALDSLLNGLVFTHARKNPPPGDVP